MNPTLQAYREQLEILLECTEAYIEENLHRLGARRKKRAEDAIATISDELLKHDS